MKKDSVQKPVFNSFEDWISNASIYIGWCRYGAPAAGFICASNYDEDEKLQLSVEDLEGGDNEMFQATKYIENNCSFWACDPDPAVAMQKLMGQMREFQRTVDYDLYQRLKK